MKKLNINYDETFGTKHSRDYYRGSSFHFSGKWVPGAHYISDDYNIDFVVHGQVLLACAKSHLSTLDNEPKDWILDDRGTIIGVASIYWDFVLTGIKGNSPGFKIIDNYWYICEDVSVPEEQQVWVNTGSKSKLDFDDLSPEEIWILQQPGLEVVTNFVNNVITQETGQHVDRIMSQKASTDSFQPKGDYATITRVATIENKIPSEASPSNQLADKAFVEDLVSTNSATFRGTYDTLTELQQQDADTNDYGFVIDSDSAGNSIFKRYKYNGSAWVFEYDITNIRFTQAQQNAIDSGITSNLVDKLNVLPNNTVLTNSIADAKKAGTDAQSDIDTHAARTDNPHNVTKVQVGLGNVNNTSDADKPISTATQLALDGKVDEVAGKQLSTEDYTTEEKQKLAGIATGAEVNVLEGVQVSGVDLTITNKKVNVDLTPITNVIPTQASSSNQLADKNFVNSSIATSTATFQGTSAAGLTQAQFEAWLETLTADDNDYVYWNTVDSVGNVVFKRYKYNGTTWVYEYDLNNSSFTSTEWAAIQSGVTTELVTKLVALPTNADLTTALNNKIDKVTGKALSKINDIVVADANSEKTMTISKNDGSSDLVVDLGAKFSTVEKTKLSGIESNAQVNKLEGVKVDGTELTITDKKVDIDLSDKVDVADSETNSDEFVYRQTGDGLDIEAKNARVVSYSGKTLAWNQLVSTSLSHSENGVTWTAQSDGSVIVNGTSTNTLYRSYTIGIYVTAGHKYIYRNSLNSTKYGMFNSGAGVNVQGNTIFTPTASGNITCQFMVNASGVTFNNEKIFTDVFDLTLMFGAGNEPTTVEEFESLFPEAYYPYNAGELISNDAESIESVGFNLWDEEWENGYIDRNSGSLYSSSVCIRSKNFCRCLPSTEYYCRCNASGGALIAIIYYDVNKNHISGEWRSNGLFTTPSNAYYFKLTTQDNPSAQYGGVYLNDICISLSDSSRNGTYEPYQKFTLPLNLDSIKVKSHNIWDEEWELGSLDVSTGQNSYAKDEIRSKNYNVCLPNTVYYGTGAGKIIVLCFYDAGKNFISYVTANGGTFTTPNNARYFRFRMQSSYGTTYNNDICINLSSEFNGKYEPHGILTMTGGLKSAGSVYDEIKDGKYVKRVGSVDMGSLQWSYGGTGIPYPRLSANVEQMDTSMPLQNIKSPIYIVSSSPIIGSGVDKTIDGYNGKVYLYDFAYTDAATFKAAMDGVMFYYALATPIEYELAEHIRTDYPVDKLGTERVISDTVPTPPFRADIEYHEANIKDIEIEGITDYLKREELTDELDKLGTIEEGAQVNKIEHIQINGTEQTITNKTVNLPAYPTTLPASDVYDWAKAATKPTYTFDEITSKEEKKAAQEFVYRKNPATINAKSLSLDRIYGKTLAWNQLVTNGDFSDGITGWIAPTNGSFTASNRIATMLAATKNGYAFSNISIINGHKYYFCASVKSTSNSVYITCRVSSTNYGQMSSSGTGSFERLSSVYTSSVTNNGEIRLVDTRSSNWDNVYITGVILVDLTLLYGSAIDGLTDAEILAKFESEFPGYHDYEPGKLISNDAESIETVGFNQWDEEWELGDINNQGQPVPASTPVFRSVNFINVFPSTNYHLHYGSFSDVHVIYCYFYDSNKQFISSVLAKKRDQIIVTPSNAAYMKIRSGGNNPQFTYNHDICINLSDPAKNGTYEPYAKSTMQLGLNSIKVKSHNIWDEEWESGIWGANGQKVDNASYIRSANLIPVTPGSEIYYRQPTSGRASEVVNFTKDHIAVSRVTFPRNNTYTIPSDVWFIAFHLEGTTYNHDICINLSSSFNGQYEPHGDITITGGLKSAGDVKDEIVGNKYIKRVGSVDLGTLTWQVNTLPTSPNGFKANFHTQGLTVVCSKYMCVKSTSSANWVQPPTLYYGHSNDSYGIIITESNTTYPDVNAFKTAMSGVMLYYELATPIEYELVSPLVPTVKVGITEERISPNADGLSAPMVADMTYSVANYVEYADRAGSLVKGASVDLTDIAANGDLSGNAFKVIAEHIAKLTSRIEALENGIGTVDTLTSNSVDSANGYYINGDKTVIIGSGAPTVIPAFAGQFYINTSGPALYYAVNNSATTDWKQA